jgi:hypothetical protein
MLDQDDLVRAEELLGDDEGPEGVRGGGARVADDVRVADWDPEGGGGVDACVYACGGLVAVVREEGRNDGRAGDVQAMTVYFLAGGRARWPCVKEAA